MNNSMRRSRIKIPITRPTLPITAILKKRYAKIIKSGMLTNSRNVLEFEKNVARYLKVRNTIAVNSCTSGLMLVLKSLGLKGDVIIPSFTFHATAHAIIWNGLRPVFVDCDPETYNIDINDLEKKITKNTSAILAVHIFGNPCDIESLEKISKKYRLRLIFDAAHGFGSKYKKSNIGRFGDAETFSLSPTKLLTTGEGGIVATNCDDLAAKIRIGRSYGDPGTYNCEFSGLSARMSEFSAILGIESLKILEKNVNRRNKIANLYKKCLGKIPGINFQRVELRNRSSYKDFSILIDKKKFGIDRDVLFEAMRAKGVEVKKYFYPPVHRQKAFSDFVQHSYLKSLKNTEKLSLNLLSLPLFSHISETTVMSICFVIENIFLGHHKIKSHKMIKI